MYDNAEKLQKKVDEYFQGGANKRTIIIGKGEDTKVVELPVLTVCGLAIFLGFVSRQSFYDYGNADQFSYIIKKAQFFIEREYEELLQYGNTTGAIFALKNMGWKDKTEQESYGKDGRPLIPNAIKIIHE